jgi:hypothetical protein
MLPAGRRWVRTHDCPRRADSGDRRPAGYRERTSNRGDARWPYSLVPTSAKMSLDPLGGRKRTAISPRSPAARNDPDPLSEVSAPGSSLAAPLVRNSPSRVPRPYPPAELCTTERLTATWCSARTTSPRRAETHRPALIRKSFESSVLPQTFRVFSVLTATWHPFKINQSFLFEKTPRHPQKKPRGFRDSSRIGVSPRCIQPSRD